MICIIKVWSTIGTLLEIWNRDINCSVNCFVFKGFLVNGVFIIGRAFALYDDKRQKYLMCLTES